MLPRLLVDLHLDTRVRLRDAPEDLDELREILRGLRLDRHRHDGVGIVDDRLEGLHVLVVAHRGARDRVLQAHDRDDVPRVNLVDGDPVRAHDHRDDLRALGLRHPDHPQLLPPPDLPGEQAARRGLARLRVHEDLRHHEPDGAVLVHLRHRLPDGALRVPLPDHGDPDRLGLEGVREMLDHHLKDNLVEGRLLRELLHCPLLAVPVDVLERDAGLLHVRDAERPLVERAPERDVTGSDLQSPLVLQIVRELLQDPRVHLRDDLHEPLLHLLRGDLELVHEPVDLVDEEDGLHPLLQRLTDHGLGLGHDALHRVIQDDHAVDRPHRARDVPAEVHVTRGVDEVNQVLLPINLVDHRRDCRVNRDPAGLLLLVVVHEELRPREVLGNHPRPRDQRVGEGRVVDEQALGHEVLGAGDGKVVHPVRLGRADFFDFDESEFVAKEGTYLREIHIRHRLEGLR